MKNGPIYFKWSVILIIFIVVIFLLRGCFCNENKKDTPITKETVRIDTFWRDSKIDTQYFPKVVKAIPPKIITVYDTLESTEYKNVDTAAILNDFYTIKEYRDTQRIAQGIIIINDDVQQNKIINRWLQTDLRIPEVTKTITITERYPRKVVFFLGGGLAGNKQTPFWGVEGNASIQFKNLKTYSAGYMLTKTGDPLYTFRLSIPIRLDRK